MYCEQCKTACWPCISQHVHYTNMTQLSVTNMLRICSHCSGRNLLAKHNTDIISVEDSNYSTVLGSGSGLIILLPWIQRIENLPPWIQRLENLPPWIQRLENLPPWIPRLENLPPWIQRLENLRFLSTSSKILTKTLTNHKSIKNHSAQIFMHQSPTIFINLSWQFFSKDESWDFFVYKNQT